MDKQFETVTKHLPQTIRVAKHNTIMTDWREDVANGMSHPLEIEEHDYIRMTIGRFSIDSAPLYQHQSQSTKYTEDEQEAITRFLQRPDVAWANDVSFDGVYIRKEINHANLSVHFLFMVYMESKQATFWRLKYSG